MQNQSKSLKIFKLSTTMQPNGIVVVHLQRD